MLGESKRNAVFAVGYSILLLVSVFCILRSMWQCHLPARLRTLLRSARKRFASYREANTDEVSFLVQAKMQQLKVDHVRVCFRILGVFTTLTGAFSLYTILMKLPRINNVWQDILQTMIYSIVLLSWTCPGVISWRTIDIFVGTLTLTFAVFTTPWCTSGDEAIHVIVSTTTVAIGLNIARRSLVIAAASNAVSASAIVGTIVFHRETTFTFPVTLVFIEVGILTVFPVLVYTLDASIRMGIRNSLENDATKEVLSAATAMLKSCCDVVVELDSEGTILSPTSNLGAFLLRGPGRCFKGSKLSELFFQDEGTAEFLGGLRASGPSSSGLAEAMHVRMKDGNGQLLRVELLWFGFRHVDGARRNMVGLREFPDRARGQARAGGGSPEPSEVSDSEEDADYSGQAQGDEDSESGAASGGPASVEVESRAASGDTTSMEIQVASVVVDAGCDGLPILRYSRGFRSRLGQLRLGDSFLDRVRKRDFVKWLQLSVNTVVSGGVPPSCKVTLHMDQGRLQAVCRVVHETAEFIDLSRTEIAFSDIRLGRERRRSHHDLRGTPLAHMSL